MFIYFFRFFFNLMLTRYIFQILIPFFFIFTSVGICFILSRLISALRSLKKWSCLDAYDFLPPQVRPPDQPVENLPGK